MTDTFIQHCITLYQALDDRAKILELPSGEKARVFAGNYTEVYQATALSRTYYSSTRKALEKHDAILILQRGARGADTVIVLKGLPESWDVEGWNDGSGKSLTNGRDYATLCSDVDTLKDSLGGINVVAALTEFEKRVKALEVQIEEMSKPKRNTKEK
jgi:hypothetical protein